ncbi:ABC transporter substrate-binding protein, partial [Oceanospirillum sp. HFRX-1_2]
MLNPQKPTARLSRYNKVQQLARATLACLALTTTSLTAASTAQHGLAMHGDLKYPADFSHFDYVNPDAPKGGTLKQAALGTFDSLNPFIIKGVPATGIGLIYDSLMESSADEPFSEYGLLAATITRADDNSWVEFELRQEARFHDGKPVTPEDVIFTFNTLREKGRPFYRAYYADIADIVKTGPQKVRFNFESTENRELPLIIGQVPV